MEANKKVFGLNLIIEETKYSRKELSGRCKLRAQSNFNKWEEQGHIPKKHLSTLEEVFGIDKYYINRYLTPSEQLLVKQMLREQKMKVEYMEVEEEVYDPETKQHIGTMTMTTTSGTDAEKALLATSNRVREILEKLLPSDYTKSTNIEDYTRCLQFSTQIGCILETIMSLLMSSVVNIEILEVMIEAVEAGLIGKELSLWDFGFEEENEFKTSIRDAIIKYKEMKK